MEFGVEELDVVVGFSEVLVGRIGSLTDSNGVYDPTLGLWWLMFI